MLSRVADSLFWLARYLERAEHIARILGVHLNLTPEQPHDANAQRWARVQRLLGLEPAQLQLDDATHVVPLLCFDLANRSSIVACILAARDNARQVREQISSEMWEQLNRLWHEVRPGHEDAYAPGAEPLDFLNAVKEGAHLFRGLTDSTMSHGEGWHFLRMGQALERSINTAVMVEAHFNDFPGREVTDQAEWIGLLRCATAFEAYCKVYTAEIDPTRVAEFLLLNPEFPHSLRFALSELQKAITVIGEASPSRRSARLQRLAGKLKAQLDFAQADELLAHGLSPFLDDVRKQCGMIHTAIYQAYIRYAVETALEA